MLKIVVTDTPIDERRGIGKNQKPYHIRTQFAYAYVVSKEGLLGDFPEKFEISLEESQTPYPRGTYTLQPSSLKVVADSFGHSKLEIDRPRLVPVASPAASARTA